MKQSAFIVGAARSGTTAMLQMLQTSCRASCRMEPTPSLNHESRLLWDGLLPNPYRPLIEHVLPRLAEGFLSADFYIEKQISLVPFMRHLHELTGCKFILMKRDGRRAVQSMLDWHNNMFPIFYQEAQDQPTLSPRAQEVLESQKQSGLEDPFDLSLPRPKPRDEYGAAWPYIDRVGMLSYYWNRVSLEICRQAESIPEEACLWVDAADLSIETVRSVFEFVGLDDFDPERISALLDKRVNSLQERTGSTDGMVLTEWGPDSERKLFDFASPAMRALGYLAPDQAKPRPEGFGKYWTEIETDLAWFEKTYEYRKPLHEIFKRWFQAVDQVNPIASVADAGFGIGYGYLDFFADAEFTGIDINPRNISHCEQNHARPGHRFLCHDIVDQPLADSFDLVFSHSTIDNVHDPEVFLRNLCRMTGKLLYVSSYRGYFPGFRQHEITWDARNGVYFNNIAPCQIERVLREEGFAQFMIFPQRSHRDDIPAETIIIASRVSMDPSIFLAHHEIWQSYHPYKVVESGKQLADVLSQVNRSCDYFSRNPLLADGLDYFARMILEVVQKKNLRPGPLRSFGKLLGRQNVAIRVDVDMDLVTAIEMARIARSVNLDLSFYLLHTAPYYGEWSDGVFYRHGSAAEAYREIQRFGSEVGVHIDALTIYLDHLTDGASAVRTEIEWLRSQGIEIQGTGAHNCAPVYGAENFEIFRSRVIGDRNSTARDFCYLPLGVLDEAELGLSYEANFAKPSAGVGSSEQYHYLAALPTADFNRNREWMRTHLLDNPHCEWGFDFRIWHLGGDLWIVAGRNPKGDPVFEFGISWETVSAFLDTLSRRQTAVLVLHPAYFGKRWEPYDFPLLAETSIALAERAAKPDEPLAE